MNFFKENSKKMSMKRFVVKTLMFVLSLIGFLIHCYFKIKLFYDQELITEYADLSSNDEAELIKLPAISVCFSGSLFKRKPSPIENSVLKNQLRSSLYYSQHRERLPPNVALLDDLESTQFDEDDALPFRRRQMMRVEDSEKHLVRSANQINQMISVDQAFSLVSKPRFSIKCDLIKPNKQRKLTRITDHPLACEQIAQVMESINYELDHKCFTFFSQLQRTQNVDDDDFLVYRSDLNGGDIVQLRIQFEDELLSFKSNQAKVHLLIHSSVEMPNFEQMKTHPIRSSHSYLVHFNQLAYRRVNTNQSPCRLYKGEEIKKDFFSLSYLEQVPTILIDYKMMLKNRLYKLLFSSAENSNITKIEDQDKSSGDDGEIDNNKRIGMPKSQSDCMDKCHLETNRKYCICLPAGVNVRRELLSANDLFCDELRCIQEDLPQSISHSSSINGNVKNRDIKNDQTTNSAEQLERLYSMSNAQFTSKRYERFKQCIDKNNCISSCEEDRYDYEMNERADLQSIVQNIISNLPNNRTRHHKKFKRLNNKKFGRNYLPDGFYYDPNYQQNRLVTTSVTPIANKRLAFKPLQPEQVLLNRTKQTIMPYSPHPNSPHPNSPHPNSPKLAVDDLSKIFLKYNTSNDVKVQLNDTKLNASIVVQSNRRNQSTLQTTSIFTNRRTANDQSTVSMSDASKQSRTTVIVTSPISTDEINSIDPDSVDESREDDYGGGSQDFTQSSMAKFTNGNQNKKSFKFGTSTQTTVSKPENANSSNKSTNEATSNADDDELDNLPIDDNIEERHNPSKSYQSVISLRSNRNANRFYRQRLSYNLIDLIFDLTLLAVVWFGFSVYLWADYLIYLIVLIFWYIVRIALCLDWWFKRTSRKRHRIVDSANSSTAQLTNSTHTTHLAASRSSKVSSKVSVSSDDSERERTFVKSIP